MAKFKIKTGDVDAVSWDGSDLQAVLDLLAGTGYKIKLYVEGLDMVESGDWIVKDKDGEITKCKADSFSKLYE